MNKNYFVLKNSWILLLLLISSFSFGQKTWTGNTSTDWNVGTNWNTNGVPAATDNVVIPNTTRKPTISVAGAVCNTLTINNTGTNTNILTITSPGTLVVSGAITMTGPTGGTMNTTINVGAGQLTAASVSMTDSGNDNRDCILSLTTGTVNISGNITMNGAAARNQVAFTGTGGDLNIGGTMTGGGLIPASGTVSYNNGGAQAVGAYTYYNLILSGSGVKTFPVISVTNDLTFSGTASATTGGNLVVGRNLNVGAGTSFTVSTQNLTVNADTSISGTITFSSQTGTEIFTGLVTINNGGLWNNTANEGINFRGGITNNGIFTAGTGVHLFDTNNQVLNGDFIIPNVTVTGNNIFLTNNNNLTVSTALEGRGRLTNTSTAILNIGGTSGISTLTATAAGNTVNYNGNDQIVKGTTYSNLTVSGSGIKTLSANATINNNLLISSNTTLLDNNFQIIGNTSGLLTLENNAILQLGGNNTGTSVNPTSFPTNFTNDHIDLQQGSKVLYNYNGVKGGFQTISTVPTYDNLECQYPGTKRAASGILNINGDFSTASHLDLNTDYPTINLKGNFNLLAVGANVSLTGSIFSIGGDFNNALTSGGSLASGNGTVVFNGTGAQSITGGSPIATPFNNLTVNKPSGTLSLTNSNQTVANNLTLTAGTLDLSTYTLNRTAAGGTLTVSNGANLRIGGATNYPTNFTTNTFWATSTVEYYANSNQTVFPRSYGNLIFSGGGIKSTSNTTAVASNFYISDGVKASVAAGTNINAGSLTLGVYKKISETWGSTSSTATYKDDGYFQSTTGIVTVTTDTRPTAVFSNLTASQSICFGTPTTTLSGTVSGGGVYPLTNEIVSITINGVTQNATIKGNAGAFTVNFNTATLPSNVTPYTITYAFANTTANVNFKAVTNTSTTLTVNPLNTIAAGTSQTACMNTAIATITLATTGATGATFTGLPAGVTGSWAGNVVTISGTPTASGTFNYTVTTTGGCVPATATGTINVTPLNTIATGINRTTCLNSAITNITLATTGATGATFAGLPSGVIGLWAGNVATISGTPTASGTFNYTVTTTGGCLPATATGTITVTPLNTIAVGINRTTCLNSAITNITLPTTGATGATFTGLPAGVTGSWAANAVKISGTPTASGSFVYTVTTTGGCVPATTTGTLTVNSGRWIGASNSDWANAGNWCGGVPTSTTDVVISSGTPFQPVITADAFCKSLTVNANASLSVGSSSTLTITNNLTIDALATVTFEDKSSLVQTAPVANNNNLGSIIYKRTTNTVVRNTDYTYWSTPVSPLNLAGAGGINYSPSTLAGSIFYSFEVTAISEDWKAETAATTMKVGEGYSIRGPGPISGNPGNFLEATFTGKPNNGSYSIPGIYPYKLYLLGNPYPSPLDADKFLTDNAGVIDGTLYFWTHNTKIGTGVTNPGSGVYAYSGDDYASYNLTGGTGTDGVTFPKGGVIAPSGGGIKPSGKIGSAQGFFATSNVTITGANEIVFNNNMRVGVGPITGDNSQFFKTKINKLKATTAIEKNRVWLNLFNAEGAFKQLLVGYITGATNEYENGYDGETFDGHEFIDFYSVNNDKNFVIQGRALPFDENDEVPLGYRTVIEGEFSIGIDEVDGILKSQDVYIEDKLMNLVHNLKTSSYTFSTAEGTFDDRFVLRYTDRTLGNVDFDKINNQVSISKDKNNLKIKSEIETIKQITVFDLLGRQVFEKKVINSNEFHSSTIGLSKQVGIVKVTLENGQVLSRKVSF